MSASVVDSANSPMPALLAQAVLALGEQLQRVTMQNPAATAGEPTTTPEPIERPTTTRTSKPQAQEAR